MTEMDEIKEKSYQEGYQAGYNRAYNTGYKEGEKIIQKKIDILKNNIYVLVTK